MADTPPLRLPEELSRRARAIAEGAGDWTPPTLRDAATVVLVRDTSEGIEVFLMRRVRSMAFAAGMYVFPGGALEAADREVPLRLPEGRGPEWLDARFTAQEGVGAALVAAAARETFEECGALLVAPDDPADHLDLALVTDRARWEDRRRALLDGDRSFGELLKADRLVVDGAAVRPWAHWVTPEVEDRRYDTRFLVAALPAGQDAHDLGGEADRVHWIAPRTALERYSAGELAMLPPTVDTITSLLPFATGAEVVAAADSREIRPIMPAARMLEDELVWALTDARTGEVLLDLRDSPAGSESRGVHG